MKVKKYVAGTMPEAMNLIRKELGSEAVILNSKEIQQGGILGFFKKKKIEVYAGLDEDATEKKELNINKTSQPSKLSTLASSNEIDSNHTVLNEINYLKKLIEKQSQDKETTSFPAAYQFMYEHLIYQEVMGPLARDVMTNVISYHEENNIDPTTENIKLQVNDEISMRLEHYPFQGVTYDKKIIQFVGPTGVGKTTTIAKVAAKSVLEDYKQVAFITTDTYRIAAIEQLKTYAKILDVPVEVAYTPIDVQKAIDKYSSYDLILVDTAGRNFREDQYIKKLQDETLIKEETETYLVLSLTAKQKDLLDIQKQFQSLPIKALIFTKLDETTQYGSLLSIVSEMNKGIAYVTNGQDVPDDLSEPRPEEIAELITGDYFND
ncbi:flagellar biosynthesis protein FlhF [Virgibacillus sp. MSJ-26]|uniref:flagellar biosynthesis protein FlhF n=1 Tax=Virgibacillus sp. MSJ-26 TaxID=2841522 RepID=UPI001C11EA77|nr:flagellar biosynthesis protein FlhF [Virgibacillus sp. MSJ-26]MBU5466760.1 flagellar biosynthesis protein FlhF [Virgibacillus sp. MSJ-26]